MWVLFYPHGTELIFKTHSLCPHPRKRVQTSSCPSISNKYRKDLKWAELWGSGAGPTSISYSCWWPGAEGKLSIEYCIQLLATRGGCVFYGELFLRLAVCSVSSPSVLFLARPRSGPAQAETPACTPATGGTAVVRHNIISVAEREGKACMAVLPSVYAPHGFKHRAPVQRTSIFMIKTCKSCPPPSFYCQEMKCDRAETLWQSGHAQSKWEGGICGVFSPHSWTVNAFMLTLVSLRNHD